MNWLIDGIAIVIILIAAFSAYRKGFVRTFFGLISVILAIVLASMFHKNLAAYIKDTTDLDEWINSVIVESTGNISEDVNKTSKKENTDTGSIFDMAQYASDSNLYETVDVSGLIPEEGFLNSLPDVISEKIGLEDFKQNAAHNITTGISDAAINVLSWFIIYLVAQIILSIVVAILDGIMSLPLLREINNIAGLGIGIIIGVFRIYIILAVIYFIATVINISPIMNVLNNSTLVSAMYNNNLLLKLIF